MKGRALLLVTALAAIAASVAAAAPAERSSASSVRLVRLTSPVSRGDYATLVARVRPSSVTCRISVFYKTGISHAKGLNLKRPVSGRVSWTWKVGTRTTPGRHLIIVSCGVAGLLKTSFVTTR
jgi:hypothetical protein